jgi:tetratricopeptide (TPR) repeat protein
MRIAAAQGNLQRANLGDQTGAFASYSKARDLLVGLRSREPDNREVEMSLARVDEDLASLAPRTGNGNADDLRHESIALFQDIARTPATLKDLALAHFYLALAKTDEGKYRDALPIWQRAYADYRSLAAGGNNTTEDERNVGLVEKHIASVYFALANYQGSLEYDRKAVARDEKRLNQQPQNPTARMDLSFDFVELGWCLHALQRDPEADTAFSRAIQLRRDVAASDPNDFHARSELESALRIDGTAKCQSGDISNAILSIREAAATGLALHQNDPHNVDETISAALDYYELGEVYRKRGSETPDLQDWQAALDSFKKAQALLANVPSSAIYDPSDREKLANVPVRIREAAQRVSGPQQTASLRLGLQ